MHSGLVISRDILLVDEDGECREYDFNQATALPIHLTPVSWDTPVSKAPISLWTCLADHGGTKAGYLR